MFLTTTTTSPFALSRWAAFFQESASFFQGFLYTLGLSIGSLTLAMLLGILFAVMASSHNKFARSCSRIFVEFFQNTPLLVHFVFVYYGLAIVSQGAIMITAFWTGILCVGLYHGAYIAEVFRSGIEAVPRGQMEAALSQGFSYGESMRLIIIPQAIRTILPPLTNQGVNLIKNTATVAIISGADIMFVAKSWAFESTNYVPAFAGAAFLYFILCFPLASWGRKIEEANKQTYTL